MALNTGINSLDAGAPELRLEGEQQAGGVYQQGSEVKNALAVWANMGPEDRAGFDGFLDFFRSGAWRDQIQGMRSQERNMRTASAPEMAGEQASAPTGTYTQRRRGQMAGGGIASMRDQIKYGVGSGEQLVGKPGGIVEPGVGQYGILSKIKKGAKKFIDPALDWITENPALATIGGGALLNQFGIPFTGTPGDRMGQNWLGELLGKGLPGGTVDMVLGGENQGQTLGTGIQNLIYGMPGIVDQSGLPPGERDPNLNPLRRVQDYMFGSGNQNLFLCLMP